MASGFETALSVVSRRGGELSAREARALAEMRARLERLRALSAEFSSVELSPYVASLLGAHERPKREPTRRAAVV